MTALMALSDATVRKGGQVILGPLDLEIDGHGATVVLGPNGAGKTTLLRLLYGLDRASGGNVRSHHGTARQSFVFQTPVLLRRSVLANAAYPLHLARDPKANDKAMARLNEVGLEAKSKHAARALSGGERQKLALGRALITEPEVLFLDEPTASLDGRSTRAIEDTLSAAIAAGTKLVLATHDLGQARRLAETIVLLAGGRLVETGPANAFFDRPTTDIGRRFLAGDIVE